MRLRAASSTVTHVVGASTLGGGHACGGRDGFETIFRHHFGMPPGHEQVLGTTDANSRALSEEGEGGLLGQYFDNQDLTGPPKLNRTDYAPSFHWYHWGPDPVVLPSSAFSVRWTGTIRSDASVKGATVSIFAQNAYGGSAFAGARLAIGPGALSGSPHWVIDAWTPGKTTRIVCTPSLPRQRSAWRY
jgi:hypothetical protein